MQFTPVSRVLPAVELTPQAFEALADLMMESDIGPGEALRQMELAMFRAALQTSKQRRGDAAGVLGMKPHQFYARYQHATARSQS